jgi:hypothetical protein
MHDMLEKLTSPDLKIKINSSYSRDADPVRDLLQKTGYDTI